MARDIIYVNQGEEDLFVERALALGFDELVLIYDRKPKTAYSSDKISIKGALINKKGFDENIVLGTSLVKIPKHTTMLVNNEFEELKDFVHHRRSGLNQVQAKQCKKEGITVLFNVSTLQKQSKELLSTYLARMKQNVILCKKYGVSYEFVSMADDISQMRAAKDLDALKRTISS